MEPSNQFRETETCNKFRGTDFKSNSEKLKSEEQNIQIKLRETKT